MAGNFGADVTYTVVKMEPNDMAMTSILHGNYQEMNASYCDQDNQYFRVFETPDGIRFIYAESSQNPGTPMPYKLIPVLNKHGAFHPHAQPPKITSFSQISEGLNILNKNTSFHLTRNPYAVHSSGLGLGLGSPNITVYPHMQVQADPSHSITETPVQFVGMKKFLLDAISEEMQRSYCSQTQTIETSQQNSATGCDYSSPRGTAFINDVSYPPLELSEEEVDLDESPEESSAEKDPQSPHSINSPKNGTKIPVRIATKSPSTPCRLITTVNLEKNLCQNDGDRNGNNKAEVVKPELSKSEKIEQLKNKVLEYLNATKQKREVERVILPPKENMLDNGSQCCPEAILPSNRRLKRSKIDEIEFLVGDSSTKSFVRPSLLGKPIWRLGPSDIEALSSELYSLQDSSKKEDNITCEGTNEDQENSTTESTNCVNSDEEICKDATPKNAPLTKMEIVHADIMEGLRQYREKYSSEKYSRSFAMKTNCTLTKLVLQRVADDNVLEIVGKTSTALKYLDVSGSPLVTNEGIQQLLVKSAKENSSLYLMSSWVHKNVNVMNDVVMSLEYLDFSYTAANFYSRRLVNLLPGSYVFPRIFHVGENDSFGHHIFYRRLPDLAASVKTHETNGDFDIQLRILVGTKSAIQFIRFAENFVWRNCYIAVRDEDKCKKISIKFKKPISMIITTAGDEKRVCGEVIFESGSLAALYSAVPIDLNLIGEHCPNLQKLSTQLVGIWRQKKPLLSSLVRLDTISEPETIVSIFQNCPCLKFVRIRIRGGTLHDEELLKNLSCSACSRTLKELWIVPSFFKSCRVNKTCPTPTRKHSEVTQRRDHRVFGTGPNKLPSSLNEGELIDGVELKVRADQVWENLCRLTVNAAKAICTLCTELTWLGNLAWWSISQDEFQSFKDAVAQGEFHNVYLEWESLIMTDLDLASGWDG